MAKAKKKDGFMGWLDKLICLLVAFPPLYMAYRFVRWYLRSDSAVDVEEQQSEPVS